MAEPCPAICREAGMTPETISVSAGPQGVARTAMRLDPVLRSCEAKLLMCIRNHWALDFGTREVRLLIEYQDGVPVLIRVTDNAVREEKLK
jgi:hypothetical protein